MFPMFKRTLMALGGCAIHPSVSQFNLRCPPLNGAHLPFLRGGDWPGDWVQGSR